MEPRLFIIPNIYQYVGEPEEVLVITLGEELKEDNFYMFNNDFRNMENLDMSCVYDSIRMERYFEDEMNFQGLCIEDFELDMKANPPK